MNKKFSTFLFTLLLTVLAVFGLAACDGGNTDNLTLDENGLMPKVTCGVSIAIDSLSPTNGNSNPKTYFYLHIYEPLFDFNDNEELVPDLGKSIEIVDDTHWRVTIFKDIKDSEGHKINADDVVYSIDWLNTSGNAVNFDIYESISKVDEYTVEFTWKSKPASMSEVEFPLARSFVFDKETFEGKESNLASNPIATGNYVVSKFVAGSSLTLKYNPNYWALTSTEEGIEDRLALHKATVNELVFKTLTSSNASIELETGAIDYCDYVPTDDIATFEANSKYVVEKNIGSTYTWLGYNMDPTSVFYNNKNLRLAIAYAINNSDITKVMPGNFLPCKSYGSSYFSDFNSSWENTESYINECNVEKAKQYLKDSGYKNEEIKIMCKSSEEDTTAVEKILAQLKAIGINAVMKSTDTTTFQTDTGDYSKWDIVIFSGMGGANLVGSMKLACDNVGSTCSDKSTSATLCFNQDETLFEKYALANNAATKNDQSVKDLIDYVVDNCYIYPLVYPMTAKVYKAAKISKIYYREGYVTLGASTYAGQSENKNGTKEGWVIPSDGSVDASKAGTYTFEDEAGKEGPAVPSYSLELKADGSFKLDCKNTYNEKVYLEGTWIINAKGVVTLTSDGVVQGAMDRLLNSGWVDSDSPTSIKLTLDGDKFTPVDYVAPGSGEEEKEEEETVPGIVTALKGNGFGCIEWNSEKFGHWYLLNKGTSDEETGIESGEAHLVVTGLEEITKAAQTEFVYHGTYTNDKGVFTFTLGSTDDEVIGEVWNEEKTTVVFKFDADAEGFVPDPLPVDEPGIVTALKNNGFGVIEWNDENFGHWYLINKGTSDEETGIESGEAHLVVTGLEEITEASKTEFVYHGTYTNDKGVFTFTLGSTDDEVIGKIWNSEKTTVVFKFDAEAKGFVPDPYPTLEPGIVTALTGMGFEAFKWESEEFGTYYLLTKGTEEDANAGEAHLVITDLAEITKASKTEFVYHGTFVHEGADFTFTLTQTDDPVVGRIWNDDDVTCVWTFDASAGVEPPFVPKNQPASKPFPVTYMNETEGMELFTYVVKHTNVTIYFLSKGTEEDANAGNAKVFITIGASTYEYSGTFVHEGANFVFTLANDNTTELVGGIWTSENTASWTFDASAGVEPPFVPVFVK